MSRKALIVWGGWQGHDPDLCASIIRGWLKAEGFDVRVETKTEVFGDPDLKTYSLIVPMHTMSKIEKTEALALGEAVKSGDESCARTSPVLRLPQPGSDDPRSCHRRLLEISSFGSPARSGPGLWGRVASLLHKPDRLIAKNRTTHLLPTQTIHNSTTL